MTNEIRKVDVITLTEQASDPSQPASGKWKLYTKSTGLFLEEDDGTVHGPFIDTGVRHIFKTVSDPAGLYNNDRAQIALFDSFQGALTITAIRIRCNDSTPSTEFAGDLKFADDLFDGSFANATVIDVCDTTSGAFTATSGFDDATVPTDKFIYLQMDAAPHADITQLYIEVYYTYD